MSNDFGYGYDWRGVPIKVGDTVIYGAGVGRSIAMVQAEVVELLMSKGYKPEPKVKLKVIHRAYGGPATKDTVTVGQDRVTVVDGLPPTQIMFTETELIEIHQKRSAIYGTHQRMLHNFADPCPVCNASKQEFFEKECVLYP